MFWAHKENAIQEWQKARSPIYIEDWLDRLVVMGVIEEEDYHREIAKDYGIPECCREWFIYLKVIVRSEDPLLATDNTYGRDGMQDYYNYVRCPTCRMKSNGRIRNG